MIVNRRRVALAMVIALAASCPAGAKRAKAERPAREAKIGQCIREAAGGRQWLEKTLWGLRDQEGGWIGAEMRNSSDGSYDLGPLQINSWWVSRIASITKRRPEQIRFWLIHDACFNVEVARWIFLSGLAATGDYWKAVGVYHSPTSWRQRRYAVNVVRHLKRRFGAGVFTTRDNPAIPSSGAGTQ